MSLSSHLILRRRVARRRREGAGLQERVWRRWYVPLLVTALALLALIVAAVAALEIVTGTHQPTPHAPARVRAVPGWRPEPGSHAETEPDVELIGADR